MSDGVAKSRIILVHISVSCNSFLPLYFSPTHTHTAVSVGASEIVRCLVWCGSIEIRAYTLTQTHSTSTHIHTSAWRRRVRGQLFMSFPAWQRAPAPELDIYRPWGHRAHNYPSECKISNVVVVCILYTLATLLSLRCIALSAAMALRGSQR